MQGCGRTTHVAGTNGGTMPCGAMLTQLGKTEPYLCAECSAQVESARGLIASTYACNPKRADLRLAMDPKGTAIAWWSTEHQRWCTSAAYAITGQWIDYPFNMRVNGEDLIKQSDWIEVSREAVCR